MSRHTVSTCADMCQGSHAVQPHLHTFGGKVIVTLWMSLGHCIDTSALFALLGSTHWMVAACWEMALINKSDYYNSTKMTIKMKRTKAMVYIILVLILSVQVFLFSYESPFFFAYSLDKDYEMNSKTCILWMRSEKGKEVSNRPYVRVHKLSY